MGLSINIENATFSNSMASLIPTTANLVGRWAFGSSLIDDGLTNQVTGVKGTPVGSPTLSGAKLVADKANGFVTDVAISGEKTFIVLSKSTASSLLIGSHNYDTTATSSEGLVVWGQEPHVQMDTALSTRGGAINVNNVHFFAGALGTSSNSLYVSKGGVLVKTTLAHTKSLTDPNPLRIGGWGVVSNSMVGTVETYEALVYNKKLTDAEIQAVFNYLKNKHNIVID